MGRLALLLALLASLVLGIVAAVQGAIGAIPSGTAWLRLGLCFVLFCASIKGMVKLDEQSAGRWDA